MADRTHRRNGVNVSFVIFFCLLLFTSVVSANPGFFAGIILSYLFVLWGLTEISKYTNKFKQAHIKGNMLCRNHLIGSTMYLTGEHLILELSRAINVALHIK